MTRASPRKLDIPALRRDRQRQRLAGRDEEAFGSPVDTILEPDFDFEKNLALFDKKAVSIIEFNNSHLFFPFTVIPYT